MASTWYGTTAPSTASCSPAMRGCKALGKTLAALCIVAAGWMQGGAQAYKVTNLVSDGSVPAVTVDANFLNPWGVSASPNWWISAANSGYNYVVPAAGTIAFKVIVPLGSQPTLNGLPAGSVTATGSTGLLLPNGSAPSFLFSTLDGTISGWNGKLGTANALSQIVINNSASGASYPGLALLNTSNGSFILAPNFTSAAVEVYDSTYKPAKLAGSFTDPNLPANYAPFSIHILGTQIFIAYAQRTATTPYRSVSAAGAGLLDVFDTSGNFVARAVTGGNLNAPWGVAFAPVNFGIFSNDLLVGNFGDGKINAYDPKTYAYQGQLLDSNGKSLVYSSLWDLVTGGTKVAGTTTVSAGDLSTVYFSAGLDGEKHGLFAGIANSTVAGSTPAFGFTAETQNVNVKAGAAASAQLSLAPVNGFTGTVALSCSGLPTGAVCTFSPSQVSISSNAVTLATVNISTTAAQATLLRHRLHGDIRSGLALACMLPFFWLGIGRRMRLRSTGMFRLLSMLLMLTGSAALVAGCGDSAPTVTPTPAGQNTVVINATAGAISQQATMTLTVQ